MPRRRKAVCILAGFIVCAVFWVVCERSVFTSNVLTAFIYSCSLHESEEFLNSLCSNYSSRLITGSLCKPLCESKEIKLKQCLGHGVKLHVLEVEWRGVAVILKSSRPLASSHTNSFVDGLIPIKNKENYKFSFEDFIYHMNRSIALSYGVEARADLSTKVALGIAQECDVGSDHFFSYHEAISCWQLGLNDEYVIYSLLQDNPAMVDVYGACGDVYALQYVPTEPLLGYSLSLMDGRSWSFRAELAVALLDMVEVLEDTQYGTLHLCDFQEPNFGVVKRLDGRLVVKAIDVDAAMFEHGVVQQMELERKNKRPCSSDEECSMFNCASYCHRNNGTCSGKLLSNNLINLCRRFLKTRGFLSPALLNSAPRQHKELLKDLLTKCSSFDSHHSNIELLHKLRHSIMSSWNDT